MEVTKAQIICGLFFTALLFLATALGFPTPVCFMICGAYVLGACSMVD